MALHDFRLGVSFRVFYKATVLVASSFDGPGIIGRFLSSLAVRGRRVSTFEDRTFRISGWLAFFVSHRFLSEIVLRRRFSSAIARCISAEASKDCRRLTNHLFCFRVVKFHSDSSPSIGRGIIGVCPDPPAAALWTSV